MGWQKGAKEGAANRIEEARTEGLRITYEGRRRTLQAIRETGAAWGDETYDAAWWQLAHAKGEYDRAKPPIPKAKKLELLHGDVAKAEGAVEAAKEEVEERREKLQRLQEKQRAAEEKMEKQKARLAEYHGENSDASKQNGADVVKVFLQPFAKQTRIDIEECGNNLEDVAEWLENYEGEGPEHFKRTINLAISQLSTARGRALQVENAAAMLPVHRNHQ